jgi:hypothetical protein
VHISGEYFRSIKISDLLQRQISVPNSKNNASSEGVIDAAASLLQVDPPLVAVIQAMSWK